MRIAPRFRRGILALLLAAVVPVASVPVMATTGTSSGPSACAEAFAAAGAILAAVAATGASTDSLTPGLIDLTIASCADRVVWLETARAYPELLGADDPASVLAARCAEPSTTLGSVPACSDRGPVKLVALPRLKPTVKGADRTRYYRIVGSSPDELFTQMQLNGGAGCPTHALACANIQPVLRPLVTTGGTCRVIGVQASLSIEAVLPRWAGPKRVPPELVAWWRKVAPRIGKHETQHIRIAERHLAKLRREIIGKPCASLSAYVTKWSRQLTAAQDAFDRKEAGRPWPAYDGPVR